MRTVLCPLYTTTRSLLYILTLPRFFDDTTSPAKKQKKKHVSPPKDNRAKKADTNKKSLALTY